MGVTDYQQVAVKAIRRLLGPATLEMVVDRHVERMSYRQIGRKHGLAAMSVHSRIKRAGKIMTEVGISVPELHHQ